MYIAAVLLICLSVAPVAPSCIDHSLSECDGDSNAVYLQINTSRDKCQQYCEIEDTCLFYRFSDQPVQGVNCLLYKEPFRTFVSHCNIRAGPKSPEDYCLDPKEDSCDIVQAGKCIYYGRTVEHFDSLSMEDCITLCEINPSCKLWTHNQESKRCDLLDSAESSCNEVFGPSSKTPTECGEGEETTITDSSTQQTPPIPIDCPANSDLQLTADQDDCESYWECFHGTVTHMTCANCFQFDESTAWCLPPEFVECGSRPSDQNCQSTTAPGPCPYPDGYFKDPDNCSKYFICQNGVSVDKTCELKEDENGMQQLLYNFDARQCDWPYRVSCGDRPICDANYENCQCQGAEKVDPDHICPNQSGFSVVPDPFNCAIYYGCDGGAVIETLTCNDGQYYDPGSFGCVDSPSVCGGRPICTTLKDVNDCKCYVE